MKRARVIAPLAVAAALAGTAAVAAEPPQAPPEVAAAIPGARLQGQATMRFLGFALYDAQLWVAPGFDPAHFTDHAFALELRYRRRLDGPAIAERSLAEMRRFGRFSDAQAQQWLRNLTQAFPTVQAGDTLSGVHLPQQPTRFLHNAQPTAQVPGSDFARLFFSIWLADGSPEPALRAGLLGLSDGPR